MKNIATEQIDKFKKSYYKFKKKNYFKQAAKTSYMES